MQGTLQPLASSTGRKAGTLCRGPKQHSLVRVGATMLLFSRGRARAGCLPTLLALATLAT